MAGYAAVAWTSKAARKEATRRAQRRQGQAATHQAGRRKTVKLLTEYRDGRESLLSDEETRPVAGDLMSLWTLGKARPTDYKGKESTLHVCTVPLHPVGEVESTEITPVDGVQYPRGQRCRPRSGKGQVSCPAMHCIESEIEIAHTCRPDERQPTVRALALASAVFPTCVTHHEWLRSAVWHCLS